MNIEPPAHLSEDQRTEWSYIFHERLGISCEDDRFRIDHSPRPDEIQRAKDDADRHVST